MTRPPLLRAHVGHDRLYASEVSHDLGIEVFYQVFLVGFVDGALHLTAYHRRAVDENIDAAKLGYGDLDHSPDIIPACRIG